VRGEARVAAEAPPEVGGGAPQVAGAGAPPVPPAGEQALDEAALREERDAALAAMRSLERDYQDGELDRADYEILREEQTARAAAAIRALAELPVMGGSAGGASAPGGEGAGGGSGGGSSGPGSGVSSAADPGSPVNRQAVVPPAPAPARAGRHRSTWVGLAAIAAFVVAAGLVLGHYLSTRLPTQQVSGSVQAPTPAKQLAAELVEGRLLASQGKDVQASKIFSQVLKSNPDQPEALAYQGWLLRKAGVADHKPTLVNKGRDMVAEAIAIDPSYPDAHVFMGYMLLQDEHDPVDAAAQFGLFLKDHPPQALVARAGPTIAQAYRDAHQPVPAEVTRLLRR
jgi:tetratricopeptide (TPR) repeat protein